MASVHALSAIAPEQAKSIECTMRHVQHLLVYPHVSWSNQQSSALPASVMIMWAMPMPELHQAQNPVWVSTAHDTGGRWSDYLSVAIGGYQLGHGFGPSRTFEQVSARQSLCANNITTSLHEYNFTRLLILMSDYSATLNTKTTTEGDQRVKLHLKENRELPEKTHSVIRKLYEIF